jgi:hypothetical protein
MQDPWHSDYYEGKPNEQKPRKYWFSYRLNKYLEPKAMKKVDGLIAVSEDYISILNGRYPQTKKVPASVITFGAYEKDFEIAKLNEHLFTELLHSDDINIVYIGRGGADIQPAIIALFNALKSGLADGIDSFRRLKFYFIGTSYAPAGQGNPTILPIAKQIGVEDQVIEITDRISYYQTLLTLLKSDALFLPGSDDPKYSASKMYPYLLTNKNLIAILNQNSPARSILEEYNVKHLYHYNDPELNTKINAFFNEVLNKRNENVYYNRKAIDKYSAENMTMHQCMVFAKVING